MRFLKKVTLKDFSRVVESIIKKSFRSFEISFEISSRFMKILIFSLFFRICSLRDFSSSSYSDFYSHESLVFHLISMQGTLRKPTYCFHFDSLAIARKRVGSVSELSCPNDSIITHQRNVVVGSDNPCLRTVANPRFSPLMRAIGDTRDDTQARSCSTNVSVQDLARESHDRETCSARGSISAAIHIENIDSLSSTRGCL
jgi:hypothetical protein